MDSQPDKVGLLFTSVADEYNTFRPTYPDALFDSLNEVVPLESATSVLEIGCGTGQATKQYVRRGCSVLAVEPGAEMSTVAIRAVKSTLFSVEQSTFEAWDPRGRDFDLVTSATAYHWIDPLVRWTKAAFVLRDGASIALLTTTTVAGGNSNEFYRRASELHHRYGVGVDDTDSPTAGDLLDRLENSRDDIGQLWEVAEPKAGVSHSGGLFAAPVVVTDIRDVTYDTDHALGLFATYSTYLAMAPDDRDHLFDALRDIIDIEFSGVLVRRYMAILAVAAKV